MPTTLLTPPPGFSHQLTVLLPVVWSQGLRKGGAVRYDAPLNFGKPFFLQKDFFHYVHPTPSPPQILKVSAGTVSCPTR